MSIFGTNTPSWIQSASLPTRSLSCGPVFDFRLARKSLRNRKMPDKYYVDFYADAKLGERLICIRGVLPPIYDDFGNIVANLTQYDISVANLDSPRRSIRNVTNKVLTLKNDDMVIDCTGLEIRLNSYLNQRMHFSLETEFTTQQVSEFITVGNHMHDMLDSKVAVRFHYFPREIWQDATTFDVYRAIDLFLCSAFIPIYAIGIEQFNRDYKYVSNGQLIYAMIHYRLKKNGMKCTLNIRLLLLMLSRLVTSPHEELVALMSQLFSWIVIDTCDSCLEKTIYFDRGYDNKMYDLTGFSSGEYRAIEISDMDARFITFDCNNALEWGTNTWPRLSHSGVSVQAHRDKSTVLVWPLPGESRIRCSMPTCYCITIKTLSEIFTRAVRSASLGGMDIFLNWFTEIYKRNGSLSLVDDYLIRLLNMYEFLIPLSNAIKHLFLALYFGLVPDNLLFSVTDPVNYSDTMAAILNTEPSDKYGVLQFCFKSDTSISSVQTFLKKMDRHSLLLEQITIHE